MKFRIELQGDVNLVHPVGKLDGGRDCEQLQGLVADMVASGCRKVVFSFTLAHWINSCGVGKLIAAKYVFDQIDGRFALCDLNRRSTSVLNTLRLDEVFEIHGSLPEALAAMKQDLCSTGS